jgi:UDP-N-acetylglucosamine/UDP-N-acetylgalactosamine diphosphorylase
MLDRPPIFLGGQGGAAGPVRVGFGTVVVAGCILREDILEDQRLVVVGPHREAKRRYIPRTYGNVPRIVRNNVAYLANLVALEHWYRAVRQPFFAGQEFGDLLYGGAAALLAGAKDERVKRLKAMAAKVPDANRCIGEVRENLDALGDLFLGDAARTAGETGEAGAAAEAFLSGFGEAAAGETSYIKAIKSLTPALSGQGVEWLQRTVDDLSARADALLPSLGICSPGKR